MSHQTGDTLRDRIAAALAAVDDWRGVTDPSILADAVIEALGLREERRFLVDYLPSLPPNRRRYVTEWENDE